MKKTTSKLASESDLESNFEFQLEQIFKKGSQTYFYSSWFFPSKIRAQVNILYAFVRTADDLVDSVPADRVGFLNFKNYYVAQKSKLKNNFEQVTKNVDPKANFDETAKQILDVEMKNNISEESSSLASELACPNFFHQKIIDKFINLETELQFEPSWTLAFLKSMESDLNPPVYQNLPQTQDYIYGSANVIGLFMARILNLPVESYYFAEHLGMSFQYINFLRDVAEDLTLGRSYFPQDLLQSYNFSSLNYAQTSQKPDQFRQLINEIYSQYQAWQTVAEKGFGYFPKKYRVAIKTASDMYQWTGRQIIQNPFIIYQKKIKPQKRQVLLTGVGNWLGY